MSRPIRRSVNRPEATRTAAARIFQLPAAVVARVECWANVVFVVFRKGLGLCPRFVSYARFAVDAASLRLENAAKLPGELRELGGDCFQVRGSKGDLYGVDLSLQACDCADNTFRGVRCKHLILAAAYQSLRAVNLSRPITESEALASLGF